MFDRDRVEHLERLADRPRLRGSTLLWVDLHQGATITSQEVADEFDLDERTRKCLGKPVERASFEDYGRYIHITTYAPRVKEGKTSRPSAEEAKTSSASTGDEDALHAVECVVGQNWVVTAHEEPIPVLDEFAKRVSGSGSTGSLDGPGFLAALLEWVLGSYSAAFEDVEQRLEEFDVHAMRGHGADEDIEVLIDLRLEVGALRRALAAHRSALVALTHPELEALGDNASSLRFQSLFARYEATLQEARDAKDAIVGSFEVLIARGGHRTNRVMTVLTLASVIFLPGALLAGVMGMNFKVGLFANAALFWVVVGAIVAIAPVTLGFARARDWI